MAKQSISKRTAWMLVSAGSVMLVGQVVGTALEAGWRKARDEDPPYEPWKGDQSWSSSLAWVVLSAAAVAATQLVARRGTDLGWQKVTGKKPPHA
ncbi:MAG TPA: DUF4235 domain-containing protein [Gemmatimonadaceae bacterium]|nr:DUF4235 domain-containing protein [Gemmatimonadaceae bacterium]